MRPWGSPVPGNAGEKGDISERQRLLRADGAAQDAEPTAAEERAEKLLPWRLEQQVAVCLNPMKVPIIVVVALLGLVIESKIAVASEQVWSAPFYRDGPTCYLHRLDLEAYNDGKVSSAGSPLSALVNKTLGPVTGALATAFGNSKYCEHENGIVECTLLDPKTGFNVSFPKDHCGLSDQCTVSDQLSEKQVGSGIGYHAPYIARCILWAVYKLVFLPVHPIDRCANCLAGYPTPMNEPVFKLLTEPHFLYGAACMAPIVTVVKIIRYSMLPNSLIVPLLSLDTIPACPNFLFYDIDTAIGHVMYWWIFCDLVGAGVLYALGKTVCSGKCVGTWLYMLYKLYWFSSSLVAILLFFFDFVILFNVRFWEGIGASLDRIFTFELDFTFSIEVVQLLATINVALDTLSLLICIISVLFPALFTYCKLTPPRSSQVEPALQVELAPLQNKV